MRNMMALEKQTDVTFLTDHLLAFGVAGEEPILDMLKLNENGKIVDNANPEAQQTWRYQDGLLTILDEDNDEIASFSIKRDENGCLVESTGTMTLLEEDIIVLKVSEMDDFFQKICENNMLVTNYQTGGFREKVKLNFDFSVISEDNTLFFWSIEDEKVIFYSESMTKILETELIESSDTLELVPIILDFLGDINLPKISVIVPVYNREAYVGMTLASLANQTMQELEFIIVNDGSSDASVEIINRFVKRDRRFKLIDKANGGVGMAINVGFAAAKGEYLAELDSDDYISSNMYEELYSYAKMYDLDIVKSNVNRFSGKRDTFEYWEEKIAEPGYYGRVIDPSKELEVFNFPMLAWVSLYRHSLIDSIQEPWNESVSAYNDNGFFWQTMSRAKRVMYINKAYIYYRTDNDTSTINNLEKLSSNFFKEHQFDIQALKEAGNFEAVKPYFFERMMGNYFFALSRLPFDFKTDYLIQMSEQFKEFDEEDGLLDINFTDDILNSDVYEIASDPLHYYYAKYLPRFYKVSVVIPVHNAEKYLPKTIKSLQEQYLSEFELIFVENGSTDDSLKILKEFERKDTRVKVLSIGPSNAGAARNVGMDYIHSKYTIFLDADDIYPANLLQMLYWKAEANNAQIVLVNSGNLNVQTGQWRSNKGFAFRDSDFPKKSVWSLNDFPSSINPYTTFNGWAWDKLIRTDFLKRSKLKFLDQHIGEDTAMITQLMSIADRISVEGDVSITHRMGEKGSTTESKYDKFPLDDVNMAKNVILGLSGVKSKKQLIQFQHKYAGTIAWLFAQTLKTDDARETLFETLVSGGLEALRMSDINNRTIKLLKQYKSGDYEKFWTDFQLTEIYDSFKKPLIIPDPNVQNHESKIIFGQTRQKGINTATRLFYIIISNGKTSNVSAVVDLMYMGNYQPLVNDTLKISYSILGQDDNLETIIHQVELEKGEQIFKEKLYYTIEDNVLSVWVEYTEQYAGFHYKFRSISSRENEPHWSVIKGFDTNVMTTLMDPIDDNLISVK